MEDLHLGASALAPALKVQTETQENMIVLLLHQKQQLALLLVLGALALVLGALAPALVLAPALFLAPAIVLRTEIHGRRLWSQ